MSYLLQIIFIVALLFIIVEDIRSRHIRWIWLFLFIASSVVWHIHSFSFFYMQDIAISLLFIFIQYIALTVIFSIKKKQVVNIFKELLGPADILLWIGIAFHFNFVQFMLFFIFSSILTLLAFNLLNISVKGKTIPLAGSQGMLLLCVFVVDWMVCSYHRFDSFALSM